MEERTRPGHRSWCGGRDHRGADPRDAAGVTVRCGSLGYNAALLTRRVGTPIPPLATISPRLRRTPGDSRGLEGTTS